MNALHAASVAPLRLRVSPVGFGCARIGSFNNPASVGQTRRLLEAALDFGVTLFDTADIYGQGDSEREVGRLLRGRRGRALVVTKVGRRFSTGARLLRPLKPLIKTLARRSPTMRSGITARRGNVLACDFSPDYLRSAVDASLRRLGFDEIDVVLLHSPSASALARDGIVEVLEAARRAGKIGAFGVACDDEECLDAALTIPGISAVEVAPPVLRARADELRTVAGERGVAVLVREVVRWRGDLSPTAAIRAFAAQPEVASVIVGTTSRFHLEQAVRAASRDGAARCP